MKIWVDADACPGVIKEILFKACRRTRIPMTLVANHAMPVPALKWVNLLQVQAGFDVADNEIVKRVAADDLVITSDIPLAAEVVAKGANALSPRGERFTADNIRQRLGLRDFMTTLRDSGVDTGGPSRMSVSDRREFANQLDRLLQQHGQ